MWYSNKIYLSIYNICIYILFVISLQWICVYDQPEIQSRDAITRFGYLYPRTTIWDARILIKGDKVGKKAVNERIW